MYKFIHYSILILNLIKIWRLYLGIFSLTYYRFKILLKITKGVIKITGTDINNTLKGECETNINNRISAIQISKKTNKKKQFYPFPERLRRPSYRLRNFSHSVVGYNTKSRISQKELR